MERRKKLTAENEALEAMRGGRGNERFLPDRAVEGDDDGLTNIIILGREGSGERERERGEMEDLIDIAADGGDSVTG